MPICAASDSGGMEFIMAIAANKLKDIYYNLKLPT